MRRITGLQWHLVVVALLLLVNVVLGVRLLLTLSESHADREQRVAEQRTALKGAQLQTAPLRGLDVLVSRASTASDSFYDTRIPATYSAIAGELGKVAAAENVRLTRVNYTQAPPEQGLVEVRVDANLSGDYAPLVRMISALERDKVFFLINGLALSGQQSGTVNLRMRITTYLRAEAAHDMPIDTTASAVPAASAGAQ